MNSAFPHLDQFLHAAARRLWLRRVVRRSQPVLFVGSLAAFIIAAGGIWLGYSPQAALIPLAIALIVVLFHAWRTRPSLRAAAIDSDRQVNLNDLLATAEALSNSPVDPWHAIILAQADHLCRTLKPADLSPQPISNRCLATCAALIALTLLMAAIPSNKAGSASSTFAATLNLPQLAGFQAAAGSGAGFRVGTLSQPSMDPLSSARMPQPTASSVSVTTDGEATNVGTKTGFSPQMPSRGAASLSERDHGELLVRSSPLPDAGGSDSSGKIGGIPASGIGAQEKNRFAAPAWSPDTPVGSPSSNWALRPDSVPAAYRDLIRAYFNRK
jgi:hypothetical protein